VLAALLDSGEHGTGPGQQPLLGAVPVHDQVPSERPQRRDHRLVAAGNQAGQPDEALVPGADHHHYAGTSPIIRQSGKKKTALARYVHNDRLADALGVQAFATLRASPGARAYYDQLRARGIGHRAALRQLGNRLVGLLHGCLKTGTNYDEGKAWAPTQQNQQFAA
jgi:hypothetical protein